MPLPLERSRYPQEGTLQGRARASVLRVVPESENQEPNPYLRNTPQLSIDTRIVKLYASLEAYVTSPSLAYAPNDQDTSSTRNVKKSKREYN